MSYPVRWHLYEASWGVSRFLFQGLRKHYSNSNPTPFPYRLSAATLSEQARQGKVRSCVGPGERLKRSVNLTGPVCVQRARTLKAVHVAWGPSGCFKNLSKSRLTVLPTTELILFA